MNDLIFFAADCVKDCGGSDVLRILKFVFILIDLVFFIVPIGLILMLMIDFGKNVIASKEDEMKKNVNMVIKRIIYCVVLFLVPTIVNFAISLVGVDGENAVSKAIACIGYAREYTDEELAKCEIDYDKFEPKNEYFCWKCQDGSGYVKSLVFPAAGYKYLPSTSFNYTMDVCRSGFEDEPVDDYFCENHEVHVCNICADEGSNVYVWNNEKPLDRYTCSQWRSLQLETESECAKLSKQDTGAEKGEIALN